jgi:RHS repeat-associated protein
MKKLISYGFVLILNFVLVCQPVLILAASEGSKPPLPPPGIKTTAAPKTKRPATPAKAQERDLAGQTSTLLSDGRVLIIGGQDSEGAQTRVAISDPRSGETTSLSVSLREARAWHSATMLPDGRVLVIGGLGQDNKIVQNAEIVDLGTQTVEAIRPAPSAFGRAYHTATLLTDGRVLIVGGESARGNASNQVELWDFKTRTTKTSTGKLIVGRQKQRATLQADGTVLIQGGLDSTGNEIATTEIFNSDSLTFTATGNSPNGSDQGAPYLAASIPENNAVDVPLDTLIGLRFSKLLDIQSLHPGTVTLNGPNGGVAAKIVPAENGRLAFVTPLTSLAPGSTYTLSLSGATDKVNVVTPALLTFTTAGKTDVPTDEEWIPNEQNFNGNWRSKTNSSPLQSLPTLQAAPGVTALAGQALTLNGRALANVTIKVGARSASTDDTGRFLLEEVATGHQVMVIDGRTASTSGKAYGIFKVGVDIIEGKTNALGYTVWMPKLDTKNIITISSPTTTNVTVSNPRIPGLELRLPPQTVLRDMDGQTVHQLSITPIPTNQPPFPLPSGVNVPVYFTIQPGGSEIIPPRAQLIYPNFMNATPGTRIDFYNYDATEKGWYVYGRGTVTPDGRRIVPDAGVVLYELSGAMVANPNNAPPEGPPECEECKGGDPVDLSTGLFVYEQTDLIVRDTLPISVSRTYRPRDTVVRPFGIGATHPFEIFIVGDTFPYTFADVIMPDGGRVHYNRISPGTGFSDAVYEHTETPSAFYKTQIKFVGGRWHLTLKDGTLYEFPDAENAQSPRLAALVAMSDRYGNRYTLTRDSNHNLTKITTPNGRYVEFTYDASNRITQAKDNIGRTVGYTYDATGRLQKVTNPNGGLTQYTYDTSHRMLTIKDPKLQTYLTNQYDTNGRVIKQTMTDGGFYTFAYTLGANGKVVQTDVTDPRGIVRRITFNSSGFSLTDTSAVGKPEQQTVTFEREAGTNKLLSITDPVGRKSVYTYDPIGNVSQVTHLFGTSSAVTTNFTYEPVYNQIATVTDPLNHTITYGYDVKGNVVSVTDALNHQATFTYNQAGQILTVSDHLQNTRSFEYLSGDLVRTTDPEGFVTTRFADDVGRLLSLTDPLGRVFRYEYDGMDHPKKTIDPLGGTTLFSYDANGNLLTITDARNNVTTFTYNNMDRVATRKDPLLKTQSYVYDLAGNLTKLTDRRGKVTNFTYDNLNRHAFSGFGAVVQNQNTTYESTVTNSYDGSSGLTSVADTLGGTVSFGYDNLARVTSETTPQGSVSYTYDAAGRRATMTVNGQPTVNYSYDAANRLTSITKGSTVVGFSYDAANRLSALSLPNNVTLDYTYDKKSQVTSIAYKKNGAFLGDLTYTYDASGRRTKLGGSFARLGFPAAVGSHTYNAANQMTQRGSTTLTYDASGNLTSDGTNTYNWDARNQLTSMSGPSLSASFLYDGIGRRIKKTVNGSITEFLYDGATAVQEISGGSPVANLLTGGLDTTFTRTDANGTRTFLPDGLGSTLALLDASGTTQTQYTYEPFGKTTASGTSSNSSQYAGRENDGTGLYFNRARYYNPTLQRFLSEDPAGFGAGINFFAYVDNDPFNFTDPLGLDKNGLLDALQLGLDLLGLIPGAGEPFDLINAGISAARGDYVGAGLSMAAMVPIAGMAATAGKAGRRAIVIGENMTRVKAAANAMDAAAYRPWKILPWDEAKAMARNEKWIRKKMKQGCEIIDIGVDPSRATRSPFYEMEKRNIGNANYPTTPTFWPGSTP